MTYYKLTSAEWLETAKQLTKSEMVTLYYLRSRAPFADSEQSVSVRELAKELQMNPGTVSRALRRLEKLEFIQMKLEQVSVRITYQGHLVSEEATLHADNTRCTETTPVAQRQQVLQTDNKCCEETTPLVADNTLEVSPGEGLESFPQHEGTHQTYKHTDDQTGAAHCSDPVNNQECLDDLILRRTGIVPSLALCILLKGCDRAQVDRAIAAYLEQRKRIKNPQGWMINALKKKYTPNTRTPTPTAPPATTSAAIAPVDLGDDLVSIQIHCDRLHITKAQAVERFGLHKDFSALSPRELQHLGEAIARW
jgi:hypothetical protein